MKYIRVLHVVGSYFPATIYGGPIYSIHQLCKKLVETGHVKISVYTTNINGKGRLDVNTGIPIDIDGVEVTYYKITIGGMVVISIDHFLHLFRNLRAFDLVHFHSVYSVPTLYGPAFCRSKGIPYIVTPRGGLAPKFIDRRGKWRKKAWIGLFDRKALEQASAVHVTSEKEAHDLQLLRIKPRHLAVIPNGVDKERLSPPHILWAENFRNRFGIGNTEAVVLFLGRINWEKGLDILVQACGILAEKGIEFRLLLAGPDPEGYRAKLELMIKHVRLNSRVIFTGALTGQERNASLAASNVVVLPSVSENFGLAAAEGMAVGKPVVVTDGVGIAQDVRKSGGGLVVPFDVNALAEGIATILLDPEGADEMGKRAASFALAHYSWSAISAEMHRLYLDILNKYPPMR